MVDKQDNLKDLQTIYNPHAARDYKEGCDKGILHSYIDIYSKIFSPYRTKSINILEIGVASGHSLLMWEEYFTKANIYGIDLTPIPDIIKDHSRITYYEGDATQIQPNIFPDTVFDIIIDDGDHKLASQVFTICLFSKRIKSGGLYIIEDIWVEKNIEYFQTFGDISIYGRRRRDDRMFAIKMK